MQDPTHSNGLRNVRYRKISDQSMSHNFGTFSEKADSTDADEHRTAVQNIWESKYASWCRTRKYFIIPFAAMILLLPLLGLLALPTTNLITAEWTSPIVYPSVGFDFH